MTEMWYVKLGEIFNITAKHARSSFYHGCHRAAWKNPNLVMYPSSNTDLLLPVTAVLPIAKDQASKRRSGPAESILKLADGGFYKVTIERIG